MLYDIIIMKKQNTKKFTYPPTQVKKVRNRMNPTEIFYTYDHWNINFIDGVEFVAVLRQAGSANFYENLNKIRYMRKDSLETIK